MLKNSCLEVEGMLDCTSTLKEMATISSNDCRKKAPDAVNSFFNSEKNLAVKVLIVLKLAHLY